jgi:hypothetical protein
MLGGFQIFYENLNGFQAENPYISPIVIPIMKTWPLVFIMVRINLMITWKDMKKTLLVFN